jgi:hypothetical protein
MANLNDLTDAQLIEMILGRVEGTTRLLVEEELDRRVRERVHFDITEEPPLHEQIPFKVTTWPDGKAGVAFSTYSSDGNRFFRVWIDDAAPNQNIVALLESEFKVVGA